MNDHPQHHFKATELDPDLLSTPFRVQTNWHVITGAPSCGKTTLIDQLADRGFQTVPETARLYIEREMDEGRTAHPIRTDAVALQRKIKDIQLRIEFQLNANDALLLDGAVPSSLAWYRAYGLNPNEILPDCFHHRYASVFILDPLPFRSDDERVEEMAEIAAFLDAWQTHDYRDLGYHVVRVPVLPPDERLSFILEILSESGLIQRSA
jgi:predicted ATPase